MAVSSEIGIRFTPVTQCPACGGVERCLIGKAPAFEIHIQTEVLRHPSYEIARCLVCDLCYKTARPSDEQLKHYYVNLLDYRQMAIDGLFPPERHVVNFIKQNIRSKAALLDFGCSDGRLLSQFTSAHACFGTELNPGAASIAESKGISIVTMERIIKDTRLFDFIILSDVFEHLSRPLSLLKQLLLCLRPGGFMIITTGNAGALGKNIAESWYFRLFGHLQALTINHTIWLAYQLGLKRVFIKKISHYDSALTDRLKQNIRHWLYRQVCPYPNLIGRLFLSIPLLKKKISRWDELPSLGLKKDHLVIVYQKAENNGLKEDGSCEF